MNSRVSCERERIRSKVEKRKLYMQVGAPLSTDEVQRSDASAQSNPTDWNSRGFNVAVLGAAGGIGQPLCLLLKRY